MKQRSKRKNWKLQMTRTALQVLQYISPGHVARFIWDQACKPRKPRFSDKQLEFLQTAQTGSVNFKGMKLTTYRWGSYGPKVLLSHGWHSKIADFRRMIQSLVDAGYVVEGVDMPAHGRSQGQATALPEFRSILKSYYLHHGPFDHLIGYSIGGLAAGIMASELPPGRQPKNLIIIAAPPYVRYFFEDVVKNTAGCNHKVYEQMCGLVQEIFGEDIDHFDLRTKADFLRPVNVKLIYDQDDETVPIEKGETLKTALGHAIWKQTLGLGHHKVLVDDQVIHQVLDFFQPVALLES